MITQSLLSFIGATCVWALGFFGIPIVWNGVDQPLIGLIVGIFYLFGFFSVVTEIQYPNWGRSTDYSFPADRGDCVASLLLGIFAGPFLVYGAVNAFAEP